MTLTMPFYAMAQSRRLLIAAVLAIVVADVVRAAPESTCLKSNADCVRSSECCSGCCLDTKCVEYADSCQSDLAKLGAGKGGPCANLDPPCKPSFACVLQQATCAQAPCKPVPTCVPPDYRDDYD
ncbi:uncharacterized protein LOC131667065 [Phymastichus coffea]|uniref:uncharacterized protein LOC131667065 n=1 Tax=Phymastichus coffea TaxID=108790 RepID=UPI00273C0B08|nr:uncharacterized protein LOC131667065 [Phymastichus coffea]